MDRCFSQVDKQAWRFKKWLIHLENSLRAFLSVNGSGARAESDATPSIRLGGSGSAPDYSRPQSAEQETTV